MTIARQTLKNYAAVDGVPSEHVPTRRAAALEKFAGLVDASLTTPDPAA